MRTLLGTFILFTLLIVGAAAKAEDPSPKAMDPANETLITEAAYRSEMENYVHEFFANQYSPASGIKAKINFEIPADLSDCHCQYASDLNPKLSFGHAFHGAEGLRHDLMEVKKLLTEFKLTESGNTKLILKPSSIHKWQIRVEIALP